jgi:outer membrane protein assembly factor BamB
MRRYALVAFAWLLAATFTASVESARADEADDWPMYQHDAKRTGFNGHESKINRTSVGLLHLKWIFHPDDLQTLAAGTLPDDSFTASPVVVSFSDPTGFKDGQSHPRVVYIGSANKNFYALDAETGKEVWHFTADPVAVSLSYNMFVSSAYVDKTRNQLYVGGGFTMYALDLKSGARKWSWSTAERGGGEVESSPILVGNTVYFGSDLDSTTPPNGGGPNYPAVYAVDAAGGGLRWFWRPASGAHPTCGDVWSSISADPDEGLLYFDTSDCNSADPGDEAVIALAIDPATALTALNERTDDRNWFFKPRASDVYDYDFGSTPLLFEHGADKYLGVGGKDGSYYVIRREKSAAANTPRCPTWQKRVVRGGFAGGFIGSSAVDVQGRIFGATALLDTPSFPPSPNPPVQPPYMHAFDPFGANPVLWQQILPGPTFAATTAINGVVFIGGVDGVLHGLDAETGQLLWTSPGFGATSSGAAVSGGDVFVGGGTTGDGLSEVVLGGVLAFTLPDGAPAEIDGVPPKLPPSTWPLGVVEVPPPIATDESVAGDCPTQ